MRHSLDKTRDMARSILPSRWRGASSHRALLHRGERHAVQQGLRALLRDPASWDDGVELGEAWPLELRPFVYRRRSADKLNHFERWAMARTRELPLEARLGHLAGVLPSGLIGEHAMVHLKQRPELSVERALRWRRWVRRSLRLERGFVAELLRALVNVPDGVRALHASLKHAQRSQSAQAVTVPFRPLRGLHDVLPFIEWLEQHLAAHDVVDTFLRAWRANGDLEAARSQTVAPRELPRWTYRFVRD